jgi:hypothetical protein
MNKQELIKEFEEIGIHGLNMFGTVVKGIPTESAIALIEQLDEPEKVKVPQFVADWIEEKRDMGWKLTKIVLQANLNEQYWRWVVDNQEKFARAWLDGYEVEEEKRYMVKIKATKHYISKDGIGKIFFSLAYKESFTKKELEEAGFGWVFNCPGIEIEEVE